MSTENVCWIHWQFDELFHPYTKYCLDQSQCQQYCKEKDHDNELFKAYLAVSCGVSFFLSFFLVFFWFERSLLSLSAIGIKWCETQRDCNRLRLMDILVKPMQRLTKYSLLLKAVHKKTDDEEHKPILIEMVRLSLLASVVVQATF